MKYGLPEGHGLSATTLENLVFKEDGNVALSDAQYAALSAGVGRGESALVVSPTSTGKTHIALWAIARSLEQSCNTVYLVTHRALAKQKFDDFKSQLLGPYLGNHAASLVVATGDYVEDAEGEIARNPLAAPLLVATYEKYLALLAATGIPSTMRSTVVVCDEIQLLGDAHRGQSVEVLLTLLRNAGCKQFVGLSAVLQDKDATDLANWLGVSLVVNHTREKHLRYECWTTNGIASANSANPERIEEGLAMPDGVGLSTLEILFSLLREQTPPLPIIVFCMTKKEVFELAEQFLERIKKAVTGQLSLVFDDFPETFANTFLSKSLGNRVAVHTADLMDEERHVVEQHLLEGKLDVVFATTTLAAGVNFPLGAAIFASWARYDKPARTYIPINTGEFHNMAGRVGRMGFEHEHGRVIFIAETTHKVMAAKPYLQLGELPAIEPRVSPERFDQLALQLVSAGLCTTRRQIEELICTTFSALREQDRNNLAFSKWPASIKEAIDGLVVQHLLLETNAGRLAATPVGKAIGHSSVLPQTGIYLLNYVVAKAEVLVSCLGMTTPGDIDRMAYLIFFACFSSPEYVSQEGKKTTRFLPWQLEKDCLFDADVYKDDLVEPTWQADLRPVNSAKVAVDWINGEALNNLESAVADLSAGVIRELFRNLCWTLQGLSSIITAVADPRVPVASRPLALQGQDGKIALLKKLPRVLNRLSYRVAEGLPDDVLWMKSLNNVDTTFALSRSEILTLRAKGYVTPEQIMLGSKDADYVRVTAFAKAKPNPHTKANWLRDTCRQWKNNRRQYVMQRHLQRTKNCPRQELVGQYYGATGSDFEYVFENALTALGVAFEKLDDKTKTGAPDYLLKLQDSPPLVVELKTRQGDKLVDHTKAVEVLAASELHGHKDTFCVTLCHPGVDPSVAMAVIPCGRLSVVESVDLGEALIRLCEGTLTQGQLWQWLATPGQALASDLPYKEYA